MYGIYGIGSEIEAIMLKNALCWPSYNASILGKSGMVGSGRIIWLSDLFEGLAHLDPNPSCEPTLPFKE